MTGTADQDAAETKKLTDEEAEAILTLVRGGWLKLELTVGEEAVQVTNAVVEQNTDGTWPSRPTARYVKWVGQPPVSNQFRQGDTFSLPEWRA